MKSLETKSNGVKGLRMVADIINVLSWIFSILLAFYFFILFFNVVKYTVPAGIGILILGVISVVLTFIGLQASRWILMSKATRTEAAQLYLNEHGYNDEVSYVVEEESK